MSLEMVKAVLTILRYCTAHEDCSTCCFREFCGKQVQSW